MLNQITPARPAHQPPEDAVDLLIGCHLRIRHFTAAAVKLAHAQGATADEIRQAAAAVYRYYSVSLPLHEADEEDTVRPRLDPVAGERVRHALLAMADQHQGIYEFVERLMPLLQLVEQQPRRATPGRWRDVFPHLGAGRNLPGTSRTRRSRDLPRHPRSAARERPRRDAERNAATAAAGLVASCQWPARICAAFGLHWQLTAGNWQLPHPVVRRLALLISSRGLSVAWGRRNNLPAPVERIHKWNRSTTVRRTARERRG